VRFLTSTLSTSSWVRAKGSAYPSKADFISQVEKATNTVLALNVIMEVDESEPIKEIIVVLAVVENQTLPILPFAKTRLEVENSFTADDLAKACSVRVQHLIRSVR